MAIQVASEAVGVGELGSKALHCTSNSSRNLITKLICLAVFLPLRSCWVSPRSCGVHVSLMQASRSCILTDRARVFDLDVFTGAQSLSTEAQLAVQASLHSECFLHCRVLEKCIDTLRRK